MFKIQNLDPEIYRKKTRKATFIVMGIFLVIGFTTAQLAVYWFGEYSNNHIVLNFMGAFVGLLITGGITKAFFADKPWMEEAIYAWKLKRNLMYIYNVMEPLKEAVESGDEQALKILRFYHLGTEQMHKLDGNSSALIDLKAEMRSLEKQMTDKELDLNQIKFDMAWADDYRRND